MNRPIAGLLLSALSAALISPAAAAGTMKDCSGVLRSPDNGAAIECLQPYADAGDAHAEMLLGTVYGTVNLPTYDAEKSAFWTRKAAEGGDIDAQVMLGHLYRQGQGVPKDLTEALRWFRTAADRGNQDAEVELSTMYLKGWGTPKDAAQAVIWARKAAGQQGPMTVWAEQALADFYFKGEGVPRDQAEAVRWFRKAASHGSPTAYLYLAQLDEIGPEGAPNLYEAYVGYSISLAWLQSQGVSAKVTDFVAKHRDGVAAGLSPEEKAKADGVVRERQGQVR